MNVPFVVYFDPLSGAVGTQKLVELLFSAVFNLFDKNQQKKDKFQVPPHPKAGRNTQHPLQKKTKNYHEGTLS